MGRKTTAGRDAAWELGSFTTQKLLTVHKHDKHCINAG